MMAAITSADRGDRPLRFDSRSVNGQDHLRRYVIDMSGTSDRGPEMPLAAFTVFLKDWIAATGAGSPPRIPVASREGDELVIWLPDKLPELPLQLANGRIGPGPTIEGNIVTTRGRFIEGHQKDRLIREAWGRARRALKREAKGTSRWGNPFAAESFESIMWITMCVSGAVGLAWLLSGGSLVSAMMMAMLSTPVFSIAIILLSVTAPKPCRVPEAKPSADPVAPETRTAPTPRRAVVPDVLSLITQRLDPQHMERARIASETCRGLLTLAVADPALGDAAKHVGTSLEQLLRSHDRVLSLSGDAAASSEMVVCGMEALAREADEARMRLLRQANDELATRVRYLSSRAPEPCQLDLDRSIRP